MLLLDDLLLLLQRQDERLLLKSHSRTLTPTPDGKTMLRPVLRLTSAMTREVATGESGSGLAQGRAAVSECLRPQGGGRSEQNMMGEYESRNCPWICWHRGVAYPDWYFDKTLGYPLGIVGCRAGSWEPRQEELANMLPKICTRAVDSGRCPVVGLLGASICTASQGPCCLVGSGWGGVGGKSMWAWETDRQ